MPSSNINFKPPLFWANPSRIAGSCEVCQYVALAEGFCHLPPSSPPSSRYSRATGDGSEGEARRGWLTRFVRAVFPSRPPSLPSRSLPSAEDLAPTNWVFGGSEERGLVEGETVGWEEEGALRKRRYFTRWNAGIKKLRLNVSDDFCNHKLSKS